MTSAFVHPTAVVDEGAKLGEGCFVWHFSHVCMDAEIGEGTRLGQNTFVGRGVKVGARVKVQNNVSIYEGVEIEDEAFIGPSVVFTNVKTPRSFVERKAGFERTKVARGASIGANAVIVCGRSIGAYAMVGAGAVVVDDVPDHAIVAGNPARRIGWASVHGERLRPSPPEPARLVAAPPSSGDAKDEDVGVLVCPATGERYRVAGDVCARLPKEEAPLPFADLARVHAPMAADLSRAFERVVASGRFILGEEVRALEAELAARVGVRHAIGVSSGTDAILASLMALDVGIGDEVITSPFSFFAGVEGILRLGATPVFADLEERGFHVDPARVEAAIGPHTKAILAPHLFGSAFSPRIAEIAKARKIPLVEDAAQAFGVGPQGSSSRCGALGALGCFSFFPTKALGALGDGGLVTTDDDALAAKLRALRSHGAAATRKYEHTFPGGNFRLDELQAALLRVKLGRFDEAVERRRRLARRYLAALDDFAPSRLVLPELGARDTAAYFVVRSNERDRLAAHLKSCGVATEVYYPSALHQQPAVRGRDLGGSNPRAEKACSEALALPLHEAMSEADVDRVTRAIADYLF